MGVDVYFVTKTKSDNQIFKSLSRAFRNLISGPEAYGEASELNQIEKIVNIELSILTKFCDLNPPLYGLEDELYDATEDNDDEKVQEIRNRIEEFKIQWETNYVNDLEDWIPIQMLKELILELLRKINTEPYLSDKLDFNFNWDEYFSLLPKENDWDNRLYLDLENILSLISHAESINEKYIGFYYQ
jgi:hypothetical protein